MPHSVRPARHPAFGFALIALLCAGFFSLCACELVFGYDCVADCERTRETLIAHGYREDGEPLDEDELCTRDAIVEARDACACRTAFEEEFRVLPHGLVCSCRQDDDVVGLFTDSCTVELVPANQENCAEHDSIRQDMLTRQCVN